MLRRQKKDEMLVRTVLYSIVPIAAITIVIIVLFWMCRRHRYHSLIAIPTMEPSPSPMTNLPPIQLLEIKARGRFGAVWKATCLSEIVAVKVFPIQDRNSWANEREIYNLPHMNQDNILRFIGTEKRGEGLDQELWLITEFHELGSLCDYLKGNVITWKELCGIALSMAKGLAFLHEDIPPTTACALHEAGRRSQGFQEQERPAEEQDDSLHRWLWVSLWVWSGQEPWRHPWAGNSLLIYFFVVF